MTRDLRLGTRGSLLASTQARWVADRLRALGRRVELVEIRTEGDRSGAPLTQIGGTGVFASALRTALQAGEIDLAVHSLKDLPVAPEPGLVLAAIPSREDPRDAVLTRGGGPLSGLPPGARIGTGSPRRAAQLQELAPHTVAVDIRGNVGTRISAMRAGTVDALVLAAAGLRRLGRIEEASEILEAEQMLPAPGQGALAIECREDDLDVGAACAPLEHRDTRAQVTAERALLRALEAGCTAPVGALARSTPDGMVLSAFVASHGRSWRDTLTGSDPVDLGQALADHLLDRLAGAEPVGAAHLATTLERDT